MTLTGVYELKKKNKKIRLWRVENLIMTSSIYKGQF